MDENVKDSTVCPFCSVGCRLRRGDGPGTQVRGASGQANPEGRLCAKGIRSVDAFDADERLTTPLVRRHGDLVEATWDEALARASRRLDAVRADHGPDALAFFGAPHCTNEENYLLQKLARTLGTNNVDNRARSCHRSAMTAVETRLGRPAMTNALSDLGAADVITVVGANPAVHQPIAFDAHVRPAVNDGTTLVHVDPRRNETTRLADLHLAPRPGTDAAVVSLVTSLLIENGALDRGFVEARTTGFDRYVETIRDVDPRRTAAATDVSLSAVEDVVDVLEAADRVAVVAGTGVEEADGGTRTADALLNLLLATGNLGRPGTGMNVFRGLNNEQGAVDMGCRPDRLPGHEPVADASARETVARAWGTDPPSAGGLDHSDALAAFGTDVRGVLAVGENPAVEKRDDSWLRDRFEALDALVVADVFPTETTEYADVVLPAAAGLEKGGTVTSLDRVVQRLRPVVAPPGSARPDFEILRALGRRLTDGFGYADHTEVFTEIRHVCPPYRDLDLDLDRDAVAAGGARWPAGRDVLFADRFHTPDGRAQFVPVDAEVATADRDGLTLVVTSRIGGFAPEDRGDGRLHVHPDDARVREIGDGDRVVVRSDAGRTVTTASVDDTVRPETVALDADAADALVEGTATTVRLEPVDG